MKKEPKKMQYTIKDYDPEKHDKFRALSVKQPYAQRIITGEKTIEVRSLNTTHRGDVMICSSQAPVLEGYMSGATLGLVELYDVKPIEDFTPEDWEATTIPPEDRPKITRGFGWMLRNPRRVVEFPVKGQLGVWNLVFTKGLIIEYPRHVEYDVDPKTLLR